MTASLTPDQLDLLDQRRIAAVATIGRAELLTGAEAERFVSRLHEKNLSAAGLTDPRVGPVFTAVDDLAVKLTPDRWMNWDMNELDRQAFGGAIMENGYLREIES